MKLQDILQNTWKIKSEIMAYQTTINDSKNRNDIQQNIDMTKVDAIVNRIKAKYEKQGIISSDASIKELRSLISESTRSKIEILKPQDLVYNYNPSIRTIGKIYSKFTSFFEFISKKILGLFPDTKILSLELYSADLNYSAKQYLAICSVILFFVNLIIIPLIFLFFLAVNISVLYAFLLSVFILFGSIIFSLKYPTNIAKNRSKKIDLNLPYALRHMGVLLRSGLDLYKVIRTVAVTDYGVLSEELTKTVMEVEEGADVKDALRALALRTKSFALKNAISHLLRALKSGGNLSEVMNTIAEDVSMQQMSDIENFSGKMNFFGVIYIFVGIVIPVMFAILSGIRNAPLGSSVSFLTALPLTPLVIVLSFLVIFPTILFVMVIYIKSIKPNM